MKKLYLVEFTVRMFVSSDDPVVVEAHARENLHLALGEQTAARCTVTPVTSSDLSREEAVNVPWNAQYGDGDAKTCGQVAVGDAGRVRRFA